MFNDPVVVLIEESEYLSQVLRLFFLELVEDIVLCPFDLLIIIKVISFKKFLLKFDFVELFKVFRV